MIFYFYNYINKVNITMKSVYIILIDDKLSFINLISNIKNGINYNYSSNVNHLVINNKIFKLNSINITNITTDISPFEILQKKFNVEEINNINSNEFIFTYEFVEFYNDYTIKYKAESNIYNTESDLEYFSKIKNIKEINEDLIRSYYIEIEFKDDKDDKDDKDKLYSIIGKFTTILYNKIEYEFIMSYIYKLFNITNKKTLKAFTNQVYTLSKNKYIEYVLPNIDQYYITAKLDGIRCIALLLNNKNLILVADKIYHVAEYSDLANLNDVNIIQTPTIILDCELIIKNNAKNINNVYMFNKNDIDIQVFDLLYYNKKSYLNNGFEYRINELYNINDKKIFDFYIIKEYVKLTKNNYFKQIKDFNDKLKSLQYETDGIIFAPSSLVKYKHFLNKKFVNVNQNYHDMNTFKWKPLDKISIDFYILKDITLKEEDDKTNYVLFSGVSTYEYEKLNLQKFKKYYDIVPEFYHNLKYFPIQFYINENTELYNFQSKDNTLNGKIGEFLYINNEWNLMRLRDDRKMDVAYGLYYGNDIKFARDNFYTIIDPLTIEMMTSENTDLLMKDIYFKKSDNKYSELRSFNSSVKNQLFKFIKYKILKKNEHNLLVDLCSGKGQDLYKISQLEFKENIFIDSNQTSINELNNRLVNLNANLPNKHKYNVYTLDLFTDYIDIRNKLNIKKYANLISINFAIHYFLKNEPTIMNLINLIDSMSNKGTTILITFLDGEKVFNNLKNTEEYTLYDNDIKKYSIIKKYKSKNFTKCGQMIGIMLPFSNGEYYDEYLVNAKYLKTLFANLNYKTIMYNSFSFYFSDKNKIKSKFNNLSMTDELFTELYSYMIIQKK